jgi:hypothetical protein
MPFCAWSGSGAVAWDDHDHRRDHPCPQDHRGHLGGAHRRPEPTGAGTTRRPDATACSRDGCPERRCHRGGHQDRQDEHRDRQDEHQGRQDGHQDHSQAPVDQHREVVESGDR